MVSRKQWSFRKKNKVLLAGSFIFLLLSYFISISNTVALYAENGELEEKAGLAHNAPQKIAVLEKQEAYWDKLTNTLTDTAGSIQNELFKQVGTACNHHHSALRSLEFFGSEQKDNYTVDTYIVVMEGSYKNLLKSVNQLEQQPGNGFLSSVVFETITDPYSRRSYLTAKLYIQSVQ